MNTQRVSVVLLDILSYREAAMARQARLNAAGASLSNHSPKPTKSKPTQLQTSAVGIQGGLVSVYTAQYKSLISLSLYEHVAAQLVVCFARIWYRNVCSHPHDDCRHLSTIKSCKNLYIN
jgi:hypothetical protein